jgi:3-oxoadipate enol-lactonase
MTVSLAFSEDGPSSAPVVVLGPSLGTTWEMWDSMAFLLSGSYRVIRYDTRGHGRSPVPEGPYDVAGLASDVLRLLDSLEVDRFAMVGLSLGGAIGQSLALTQPSRLTAAVLCCTVPWFGGPTPWEERAARVRARGMSSIAEASKGRWFTDDFRSSSPAEVDRHIDMLTSIDPVGYASCCEALAGFDVRESLPEIAVPVRVVAAEHDPVAVPDACEAMADAIPGADLVVLPDTSHIATVAGEPFERAVTEHLERHL